MSELPSIDDSVMEGDARYALDKNLKVRFYKYAVKNEVLSEDGPPVFNEIDFIEILIPGDVKSSYIGKVNAEHKHRFKRQWQAYLDGESQATLGIPLDKLPGLGVGQLASFNAMGITTVEQLAGLTDQLATGILGIQDLRRKAAAYLKVAAGDLTQTNTDDIETLKAQIAALTAQLAPKTESKKAA